MGEYAKLMENEMSIRGLSYETKRTYLGCMKLFVKYFMRPPSELTLKDINTYQIYLTKEKKVAWSTFNQHVCAIRFFYKYVLKKDWELNAIPRQKGRRKLPTVLSKQEIGKILDAISCLKHRAIFITLYSTGLRASEVTHLKPADIESDRMVIRVNQGKGRKDRYVVLSPHLLATLRSYWKGYWSGKKQKPTYLFPGIKKTLPMCRTGLLYVIKKAAKKAGLDPKRVSGRILRHTFSTHSLEDGTNIRVIQALLGHRSLATTSIYAHVAADYLKTTPTPIDSLLKDKELEPPNV